MKIKFTLLSILVPACLYAQDDLLKELEKSQKPETEYINSTFKGTRIVNGQSVETKGNGELEFIFAHRFGPINSGLYNLYGLDQAYTRLGLEYGLTDRLGLGIGRNAFDKTMDSYVRYKLLRQSKGLVSMPFTVTVFANAALKTSPRQQDVNYPITTSDRMSYTAQLLIARKFNSRLSLQLMPTVIHKNVVDKTTDYNDLYALGVAGRLKLTRSIALTTEYYYRLNVKAGNPDYNSIGFGIDIETGGHVFQLVMTNANQITERAFIGETTEKFFSGGIHLGFNVTRTFQLKKRK
jgi:hypothetical protein